MKILLPIFLLMLSNISFAAQPACDELRADIETASELLNKAQEASSFDNARQVMDNAKYSINQIAEDARSCPCNDAAALFDAAATKLRRASDADSVGKFNQYSSKGIENYGAAIDALNNCPASQQNNNADLRQP